MRERLERRGIKGLWEAFDASKENIIGWYGWTLYSQLRIGV